MDKETLSNYGWIVICVMILAVMLALATPFGNFIAQGFKSIYEGFGLTSNNALGVIIPGANGPGGGSPEEPHEPNTLYYYQPYKTIINGEEVEYVFYEDGSAVAYNNVTNQGDIMNAGTFTYGKGVISIGEEQGTINEDGSVLTFTYPEGQQVFTWVPTEVKYIDYRTMYTAQFSTWKEGIMFYEDGAYALYMNGEFSWTYETLTYKERHIEDNDFFCTNPFMPVHPSGQKIIIGDTVYNISNIKEEASTETPLIFNQPYTTTLSGYKYEFVFHEDGASEMYMSKNRIYSFGEARPKHTSKYNGTQIYIALVESNATISEDGQRISVPRTSGFPSMTLTLAPTSVNDIELDKTWAERDESGEYYSTSPLTIDSNLKATRIYDNVFYDTIQLENHGYYMSGISTEDGQVKIVKHPDGTKIIIDRYVLYQPMPYPEYKTPNAKFSDGKTLTWTQLMDPANGAKYGYDASVIGATSIGEGAFENCTTLVSIILPKEVSIISKNAFFNCTSVKEITLSNHVTKFDFGCFKNCSSLTRFNFNGYAAEWRYIYRELGNSSDFDQGSAYYTAYCIDGNVNKATPK